MQGILSEKEGGLLQIEEGGESDGEAKSS